MDTSFAAAMEGEDHDALIELVKDGFGALLEQVQDLAAKNDFLGQKLSQADTKIRDHANPDIPWAALQRRSKPKPDEDEDEDENEDENEDEDKDEAAHPLAKPRNASELGQKPGAVISNDLNEKTKQKARLIAQGVQAWKKLTARNVPDPTGAVVDYGASQGAPSSEASEEPSAADKSDAAPQAQSDTSRSSRPGVDAEKGRKCPFASTFGSMPTRDPNAQRNEAGTQQADSLPMPPEISIDPIQQSPPTPKRKSADLSSAAPSASGSTSKCPIRFLDHYSPEEVAEYFKNHKHEIPRSHEVCVKRYQSNAESIRQLDAKYGSLENMIQGLGAKHQPLLPPKEEEENPAILNGRSIEKIEKWAEGVDDDQDAPHETDVKPASNIRRNRSAEVEDYTSEQDAERAGRFERVLREVRLGESPSRPWGLSLPLHSREDDQVKARAAMTRDPPPTSLLQEVPRSTAAVVGTQGGIPESRDKAQPHMVFTGPVFIGYSPEDAAVLLHHSGLASREQG